MRVLVLGAGGNAANNVIRSIKDEHYTLAVDRDPVMLNLSEAHACIQIWHEDWLGEINAIADAYAMDAVWAQPTPEVSRVANFQEELRVKSFVPHLDIVQDCNDKLVTAQRLSTIAPHSGDITDVDRFLKKYDQAWLRLRHGAGSAGAITIRTSAMAMHWMDHHYDEHQIPYDDWMVARKLPGRDLSWTGIYHHGQLVISAAKERLQLLGAASSPSRVSSTAKAQTVVQRSDINAVAERAIELMAGPLAHGVFMVDMREDKGGSPKVTEVNAGRFGTTCDMYMHCGPNLPLIAMELLEGTYEGEYGRRDEHTPGLWLRNTDCVGRLVNV